MFVQSLSNLLRGRGQYEVQTARTAEDALEQLQESDVDLALVDISLPGRNGIWLVSALRAIKPRIPCLILSGYASKPYMEQAMEAGARGYVLKEDVPGILDGIRLVLTGGMYISEAMRGK
jgi:DNA-binding NarL/FixJ family response regulator